MHMKNLKEKELFIRYGSSASEAMFDFPCKFFQLPGCNGIVAYREVCGCAVIFGDPMCPESEIGRLIPAFHSFCKKDKLRTVYVIITKQFADWLQEHDCKISMRVCDEFILDPTIDLCEKSSRMRQRVNKAIKHGLTLHEYIPYDAKIEKTLKEIGIEWQQGIKGHNIYLGHLNFFEDYIGKRWFYVKDGGAITSMLMLSRLDKFGGWLLKFLVTRPNAFQETSEFLMTSVLDILKNEGCRYLSKGTMPVSTLQDISGFGPFATWASERFYDRVSSFFSFEKRKEYWMRYSPKVEPAYLVVSHMGLNEIRALTKVFRNSVLN